MELLRGERLEKKYKTVSGTVTVIGGIDLVLNEGEILGVVGESGSGKSTLLKLIAGLEKPDNGRLFYKGKEYSGKGPAYTGEFLQMVFQDAKASFDPRMKMYDSVTEGCRKKVSEAEVKNITESLGLQESLLYKRPGEISGGECQRMSIARALVSGAGILLCDEITSALDVSTQKQITGILNDLNKEKKLSMIFVSHDIALVSGFCDRMIVLNEGSIAEEGKTQELIRNPKDRYTGELIRAAKLQSL